VLSMTCSGKTMPGPRGSISNRQGSVSSDARHFAFDYNRYRKNQHCLGYCDARSTSEMGHTLVHYLDPLLFPWVHQSLVPDGFLYVETVGGQGGNYLELPEKGKLQSMLLPHFRLEAYQGRPVGAPGYNRCAVTLLAKKCEIVGT
jgi:hypothetical protein